LPEKAKAVSKQKESVAEKGTPKKVVKKSKAKGKE